MGELVNHVLMVTLAQQYAWLLGLCEDWQVISVDLDLGTLRVAIIHTADITVVSDAVDSECLAQPDGVRLFSVFVAEFVRIPG